MEVRCKEVRCKNFARCHHTFTVVNNPVGGRRKEFHSTSCRKDYNRHHPPSGEKQDEERHAAQKHPRDPHSVNAPGQSRRGQAISVPPTREILARIPVEHIRRHELIVRSGTSKCRVCGWSWTGPPTFTCPGGQVYAPEAKPPHLLSLAQLKSLGLRPVGDGPDAFLRCEGEPGWKCLYDQNKAAVAYMRIKKAGYEGEAG